MSRFARRQEALYAIERKRRQEPWSMFCQIWRVAGSDLYWADQSRKIEELKESGVDLFAPQRISPKTDGLE